MRHCVYYFSWPHRLTFKFKMEFLIHSSLHHHNHGNKVLSCPVLLLAVVFM